MANLRITAIDFQNKAIESYLNWEKCSFLGVKSVGISRFCIENVLKTIILNESSLNVIKFDKKTFKRLFDLDFFPPNTASKFGVLTCYSLVKKNTSHLNDPILASCFTTINKHGNDDIHEGKSFNDDEIMEIGEMLLKIMDWFFVTYLTQPIDWKEKEVDSKIRELPPNIMAKQITGYLNNYLIELNKNNIEEEDVNKIIANTESIISELSKIETRIIGGAGKIIKESQQKIIRSVFLAASLVSIVIYLFSTSSNIVPTSDSGPAKIPPPSFVPFDTSGGSYNILLFPFHPLENCSPGSTNMEWAIIGRLQKISREDNLNLKIKLDTIDCIHKAEQDDIKLADSIGRKLRANLVIWGDLYRPIAGPNETQLKYINFADRYFGEGKGETDITKVFNLSDIRKGKLQEDIDYIIYWIAASRSYKKMDYTNALKHLAKVRATEDTSNLDMLYGFIAECFSKLNLIDSSKIYYKKALKINPEDSHLQYDYATLLDLKLKDKKEAKKHYQRAIELNPKRSASHANYALFLIRAFGDTQGAMQQFEEALKVDPKDYMAHAFYAVFLEDYLKNMESALYHFEKSLQLNPNQSIIEYRLALSLDVIFNKKREAKKHYENSLFLDSSYAQAHCKYAMLLLKEYDLEGAEKYCKKALRIDSNLADAHLTYCGVFSYKRLYAQNPIEKLNYFSQAKEQYLEAVRLNPKIKNKESDMNFGIDNK